MDSVKIFLLVLSVLFSLRYVIEFIGKMIQTEPEPMVVSTWEKLGIYLSLSYIITSIITSI